MSYSYFLPFLFLPPASAITIITISSEIIAERITAESSVVVTFIHLRQSLSFMKENSYSR